jgi:PAS domain-containing protein
MTKLSLEIVVAQSQLQTRTSCAKTASILGISIDNLAPAEHILADAQELRTLQDRVNLLTLKQQAADASSSSCFETLNLVFKVSPSPVLPTQDRSPLDDVCANPVKAIHVCGELQVACFVHLELMLPGDIGGDIPVCDTSTVVIHMTALEYTRSHRKTYLRQEFGSWLLEEHIEMAVIATTLTGTVCFWNRFASELYHYARDEAMGQSIMELTPAEMTQEQGIEIMTKLSQGDHWKVMPFCVYLWSSSSYKLASKSPSHIFRFSIILSGHVSSPTQGRDHFYGARDRYTNS